MALSTSAVNSLRMVTVLIIFEKEIVYFAQKQEGRFLKN